MLKVTLVTGPTYACNNSNNFLFNNENDTEETFFSESAKTISTKERTLIEMSVKTLFKIHARRVVKSGMGKSG